MAPFENIRGLDDMKALVTGGSGFIGAWIIAALMEKGYGIRSFDIKTDDAMARRILGSRSEAVDWWTGDVADGSAISEAAQGCDLLVHLAAILTPDCQANPIRGAHILVDGTLNVFEAARRHSISRVLYMSSAGVFGPEQAVTPEPTTLYGAFKLAGEGAARAYWADHGIASAGFRPLIVYGPERVTGMTAAPSLACRAAARGEDATIPFSGETDFVYVTDVAAAFAEAAAAPFEGARVYNITGESMTAEAFALAVERAAPGVTITAAGPLLPIAPGMDGASLRRDFPTVPLTTVADGVARTIAFYREEK
jgi:UDP-glucose 4-epimerase